MKCLIHCMIASALYITSLSSFDRSLDVSVTTDFSNLKKQSHVDIISQAVVPFETRAFLLSPQASIFFDGSLDMSIAAGLRHQTPHGMLGHHLFWSLNLADSTSLQQIGHSLDFLTDMFDYRINYYHPISDRYFSKELVPQRWWEAEMVYKHESFAIGLGPRYNVMSKDWGMQSKFIIPFEMCSVGSFFNYDKAHKFSGGLCISLKLFGTMKPSHMESPIIHSRFIRYAVRKEEKPKVVSTDTKVTKEKKVDPKKELAKPAIKEKAKEDDKPVNINIFLKDKKSLAKSEDND